VPLSKCPLDVLAVADIAARHTDINLVGEEVGTRLLIEIEVSGKERAVVDNHFRIPFALGRAEARPRYSD
jgi:hypothetical protein